jgi:putative superfamily III holin-X
VSEPYPQTPAVRADTVRTDARSSDVSDVSVGQLVSQVTNDLSTLMRQELELAKAEIKVEVQKGGKAAGMLGGAGAAGYFALLFLSLTIMFALAELFGEGPGAHALGALIVTAIYGIAGAVLFLRGRREMQQVSPTPTQTVETLKEDVQWAKTRNR